MADSVLSKDLMQMGVAIESSNVFTKAYSDNQEALVRSQKNQTLRLSSLNEMQYKLSYVMASSMTGKNLVTQGEDTENLY